MQKNISNAISNEDSDYEEYLVRRERERNLKFLGRLLAEVSELDEANRRGIYLNKWQVLKIFQTKSGKFVCAQETFADFNPYEPVYRGAICEGIDDIVDFFRCPHEGSLNKYCKTLFTKAGIDDALAVA
jgi:hypothetical protein